MYNQVYFTALILVFIRIFSFFMIVPVFFPKGTPTTFKVAIVAILSYILMPGIDLNIIQNLNNTYIFIFYCINEVIIGLTLGYLTNLCFNAIAFAGNLMDMQVGLSMISMFDPTINSNTTLMERLLYWTSLVIFFIVDGHHMLIKTLIHSFDVMKFGQFILIQSSIDVIFKAFTEFFYIGLKIAIPIVLIIIITDLTMGLIARTVPQLNIMILGMPVKILVGLLSFAFALPLFLKLIETAFQGIPDAIQALFKTIPLLIVFASDDKTEEATSNKKSEARKKGQVAKSKEVALALTLVTSAIVLLSLGSYVGGNLKTTLLTFLNNYMIMSLDYDSIQKISFVLVWRMGIIFLPIVVPIMLMGVMANYAQTGFIYSKETLKPDFKKLNPLNGFKKIFSMRTLVELIKDVLIVSIVSYVGYGFIKDNYMIILNLNNLTPEFMVSRFLDLVIQIFFKIAFIMIVIAISDYIFQRYQYNKDLKMSKQEVKEEFKQQEGDPKIKGEIRQKQKQMAMSRMMQQVPKASVVVTNPTHFAVALQYEKGDVAPKVIAKGADFIALKIKEVAKSNGIPIIENRPLARMLYDETEIQEEIPVEMYQAVAEILAFILKLKKSSSK